MAYFCPLLLQFGILSLWLVLTPVAGKALQKYPGSLLDMTKPEYLLSPHQEAGGERPVVAYDDDEDYRDPADEKQYFYDQQPQQIQSIDDSESKTSDNVKENKFDLQLKKDNFLPIDNGLPPRLRLAGANSAALPNNLGKSLASPRSTETFDGLYESRPESVDNKYAGDKSILAGSAKAADQSGNTSASSSSVLPNTMSNMNLELGLDDAGVKNSKRGVIGNKIQNETGKTEAPPTTGVSSSGERLLPSNGITGLNSRSETGMSHNSEPLGVVANDNELGKSGLVSEIPKDESTMQQAEIAGLQSDSTAAQQPDTVARGRGLSNLSINSSDTAKLNSNDPDRSINSSANNTMNNSVQSPQVITNANGMLKSSSQMKPRGESALTTFSLKTNISKDGGETQQITEAANNKGNTLLPLKQGTVSLTATSKASLTVKSTSPKTPASSTTSKALTTTATTPARIINTSTTALKGTSIKSDDSDLIIDQVPESGREDGSNDLRPNQGEFMEEGLPMVHSTPANDKDSHFFAYFASLLITAALGYVVYHNKNKILALLLEGRRGRVSSGSRRGSSAGSIGRRKGRGGGGGGAKYQPLHTSLDQVMTSNGTEKGGDSSLDRIY